MEQIAAKLKDIFENEKRIKLVYFFGSQANGQTGPLSDYDFAFYAEGKDVKERFQLKMQLISELSMALGTNKVDVVILNDDIGPELKYNIIQQGELIYQQEPYRVMLEPRILNEYFDFVASLKKYALTQG
jgi:predicted nucleotidyltransferase